MSDFIEKHSYSEDIDAGEKWKRAKVASLRAKGSGFRAQK